MLSKLSDYVQDKKTEGTNHRMYRWWKHEIVDAVKYFCPDREDLIKYFEGDNLWYQDDILKKLGEPRKI